MKNKTFFKNAFIVFVSVIFGCLSILLLIPEPFNCLAETDENTEIEELYFCDDGFSNAGSKTTVTETFAYATKETVTNVQINNTFPAYYNTDISLTNACGSVAGANVIGFYDRFFENLIPDHSPGVKRGSNYYYNPMTVNKALKQAVIEDLYVRMGTNASQGGTSITGYLNGLSSYVQSNGYSFSYDSLMNGSTLSLSSLIQSLNEGKPVTLFLQGFNISRVTDANGTTTIEKDVYNGSHIIIVYGISVVNYYNSANVLVKVKTYLSTASGIENSSGYYILNNNGTIVGANNVQIS